MYFNVVTNGIEETRPLLYQWEIRHRAVPA